MALAHAAEMEPCRMIEPTLSLRDAAGTAWDALVVGAGPAGSLAARELRRRGRSVLLVDRATFPRWKVCGSCLNGSALATLRRVALADLPARLGAVPIRRLQMAAGSQSACVPLAEGVSVSRERFDAALVAEAIEAGTSFLPQTRADFVHANDAGVTVRLLQNDNEAEARARVVLAADGLGGTFLPQAPGVQGSRVGAGLVMAVAPMFYQSGTIYMACGAGGYLGLVRLEDGRLDLAAALDRAWVRESGAPGAAAARMLDAVGWPKPGDLQAQPWRGTTALTRAPSRVAGTRIFALGDAAGYVEPFTGEGMAWALAAAEAVAPLADRAIAAWRPEFVDEWTHTYRRVVQRRQRICRVAASVLRRPWLTRAVIAILAHAPRLARPIVCQLNTPQRLS
jgi:menaquinone-9 beta-reductase